MTKTTTIIAVCGPSGAGKSRFVKGLLKLYPHHCTMWQQFTTRQRRPGEGHADYVFITRNQYSLIEDNLTCRTEFNSNLYGTMPEAWTEGKAVLTIVDRDGLDDLFTDVEAHNLAYTQGESGKLGDAPVQLVRVLMHYELTPESIEERGRASRGLGFVQQELRELRAWAAVSPEARGFQWEFDTSNGNFPDPTPVFEDVIWPMIDDTLERAADMLTEAREILSDPNQAPWFAARLLAVVEELVSAHAAGTVPPWPAAAAEPGAGEAPAGPAPLSEEAAPGPEEEKPEGVFLKPDPTAPEDAAALSVGPLPKDAAALSDEQVNAILARSAASPDIPVSGANPAVVTEVVGGTELVTVAPPVAPDRVASFRNLSSALEASPLEQWISRSNMGMAPFQGTQQFEQTIRRWMLEHRVVLKDQITFASRPGPSDHKGGRVTNFVVVSGGERVTVVWNDRLKRISSVGVDRV